MTSVVQQYLNSTVYFLVIADLLDLSERPLYRIIKKYGLRDRPQVELNDAELDAAVSAILAVFPNSGESSHLIIWKVFLCCGQ